MLVALGVSPLVAKASVSFESTDAPLAASCAPPVNALLSQPLPALPGGLAHGQALTLPAPGSQIT
jgi:hypothetical protein